MMQRLRRHFKTVQFAALAVFTLICCSGCSLVDALIDGAFLGVSETVGSILTSAVAG